ncbi:MAG: chromosome condensation regulator RCC1 [Deltaproteobacteria bacterium]|nr:chromosome condensation regulator RCC1 [Deltaproteobacteria bacterium]
MTNARATCTNDQCGFTCNAGFSWCGGQCVIDSITSCGPSCAACPGAPADATPLCRSGQCTSKCDDGFVKCGGGCCRATAVSAGESGTCILIGDGGAKCWGRNYYGQVGDGTYMDRNIPVDVQGLDGGVLVPSVAGDHKCAVTSGGGVKCWGSNGDGQLGIGTSGGRYPLPIDVVGLTEPVVQVSAGSVSTCALTTDGGVKCWGYGGTGQLGDGTWMSRSRPTDVVDVAGAKSIATGSTHVCSVMQGGGVKCWGTNNVGQLGDGTSTIRLTPVDVVGLSGVSTLAASSTHTCARMVDGRVKCWGKNDYGQLGDGTTTNRLAPVDVLGLTDVTQVSAAPYQTCALTSDGGVLCWGGYSFSTPTSVSGLSSGVTAIATGHWHTCALTVEGAVKCWGDNYYGVLGTGDNISRSTPTFISGE